jgi:hypothetical protein
LTTLLNYCRINKEIDTKTAGRVPETAPAGGSSPVERQGMSLILAGMMLALAMTLMTGCAVGPPYAVAVAEERMVSHCTYIATISENSDMGAFQIHPKFIYDGRDIVLRRAEMLNATHVVFLADYPSASAVMAYHCPE